MISNHSWKWMSYLHPAMVLLFMIVTVAIEAWFLNRKINRPTLIVPLVIIANLGSFVVGLPLSNSQYFLGFSLLNNFYSFFYDLPYMISSLFRLQPDYIGYFVLYLLVYLGALVVSTVLETLILKKGLRTEEAFTLRLGFQMNFLSHLGVLSVLIIMGAFDAIALIPLDAFFIEALNLVDANITWMIFLPYSLVLVILGLGCLIYLIFSSLAKKFGKEEKVPPPTLGK